MGDTWNIVNVEPLDDKNYFTWKEKIEGVLRSKKVIGVKPVEKLSAGVANYEEKLKSWDEWDDNNYAARTVMINTMSKGQLMKYSSEKSADKLWSKIKLDMAAETEEIKARSLNDLSNIKMARDETVDAFINRAEGLKNQCIQLGRDIEEYELKMYILRGLRPEYDPNVKILESQKNISVNDIRFALNQEELIRVKRKEQRANKDYEIVRKVKEGAKTDGNCYNCGIKGHMAADCKRSKKCFNCQGFNHIAADCRERKRNAPSMRRRSGENLQSGYRGRNERQLRGRGETTLKTYEEAVMRVSEISKKKNKLYEKDGLVWQTKMERY
ncbi:uncharacterized protein LOC143342001 [Colletes latitarsis]|uniref:uncharacterized protein LOC143342001 n=1 Tax=Colletes latitarsis TaxID=2605962 RepID=UPI0040360E10